MCETVKVGVNPHPRADADVGVSTRVEETPEPVRLGMNRLQERRHPATKVACHRSAGFVFSKVVLNNPINCRSR